jgi:serine/threonine protein kinase/tetratricopeptide (TPR) repeat protein
MIGQTISHYKILEKLGGGGMGVVYKAQDIKLDRPVALKFLPPDLTRDPEAKERFVHEAKAASALQHNNICTVHDIEETSEGQLFIVMDFYDGETLKKKIERRPLKIEEAADITVQILEGLAKAHEHGIVHRDIKPANIMVTRDGVAKIVDFGLAKLTGRTLLTKAGSTLGTAAYMSPEQARGESPDARTDIWSLGVTFYEMLIGHRPFESDYEQALVYSILNEDPKPMRDLRSEVPEAIEKICRRSMAKEPRDRYQSATELIADLESFKTGTELSDRTRKLPVRKRRMLYAGAAVILAIAAIVGILYSPGNAEAIDTIAVLPFINASGDADIEYLCDGLTEAVLEDLCRAPGFRKVIALNSVMQYKNKEMVPGQVSKKLDVTALVISRLYKRGDELTISVELINGRDETRIWGNQYKRPVSQLTALRKDISGSITENLHLRRAGLTASRETRQYSQNPEACRLYLQGQHFYHRLTEDGLRKAIDCYRKALLLDPKFALAYAGISNSYNQLVGMTYVPWEQAADSMRQEASNALAIDRNLAEAHLAISGIRYYNYEREECVRELKEAIELNPLCADAIHMYAHVLSEDGRHEEGIRLMRQSTELEPLSAHYQYCLAGTYQHARRWDEALREHEKVKEIDSAWERSDPQVATIYFYQGNYDKAIERMQRFVLRTNDQVRMDILRAKIYAATGKAREARLQLDRLYGVERGKRPDPAEIAAIHSLLGSRDSAMVWLERAYRQRSNVFAFVKVNPEFDSLRSDPGFKQLLARAGFTE